MVLLFWGGKIMWLLFYVSNLWGLLYPAVACCYRFGAGKWMLGNRSWLRRCHKKIVMETIWMKYIEIYIRSSEIYDFEWIQTIDHKIVLDSRYCAIVILCEDPLKNQQPLCNLRIIVVKAVLFSQPWYLYIYVWVSFVSDEPSLSRAFETTSPIGLVFPWKIGYYFAIVPICSHLWYRMDEHAIYQYQIVTISWRWE